MTGRRSRPTDVKWSYENYRGASAELLHEKTKDIELVDDRTIRFQFNEPFLDFPILLGTGNLCGAGWVVPAKYYEQVGKDGFLQKPIGAGPYKLVSQEPGAKLEFEAFEDYYRPVHIKQLRRWSACPRRRPGVAMLERGRPTSSISSPGELIDRGQAQSEAACWRRCCPAPGGSNSPAFQDPNNPFHDKRVRQAISLAIDRKAINDAESGGMGMVSGNWINNDVEVRARMAGVRVQRRQGQAADGGGRLSRTGSRSIG